MTTVFNVHSIVTSVAFFMDVHEITSDSFFRGHAFITNKDKITQPLHPMGHAVELTDFFCIHFSKNSYSSVQPVAADISDGEPDHFVTFELVKVACITMLDALDVICLYVYEHSHSNPCGTWQSALKGQAILYPFLFGRGKAS